MSSESQPTAQVRILIVDDHFVVRIGLVSLVNTEPDLLVVGEADDGEQAIALFQKLQPDLVLMDLRMPGMSGPQATTHIRRLSQKAHVLILSAFDGDQEIHEALEAGARGYVLKSATGEDLIPAIRAVAAGKRWIHGNVAARLRSRNLFEELTPRELEALRAVVRGLSNKELADALSITEHTAKGYLKSIFAKLRVSDRTQAVTAALQRGIVRL